MAITNSDVTFLFYCKKIGVSFKDTLMLGRLRLYATKEYILKDSVKFNNLDKSYDEVLFKDDYCEPFLEMLGADFIDSLDVSDYENATIIHDMNYPLDKKYDSKYTVVIDGGTIEHVFNFTTAITNSMKALKVGGHYLGMTPANNLMGHGFFQFSPELYYRIFSLENGFRIIKMFCYASKDNSEAKNWYEVMDPKDMKGRVWLVNSQPTFLLIIAEKIADKELFTSFPQQSDYVVRWQISEDLKNNPNQKEKSIAKRIYKKLIPEKMQGILRKMYAKFRKARITNDALGTFDPRQFKPFDP